MEDYNGSTFVKSSMTGAPISASGDSIVLKLGENDIAFVLGKRGQTKQKLARVSGAKLDIDEKEFTITITGPEDIRRRAQEYVDMVLGQRNGSVQLDLSQSRNDLTCLYVPEQCVGYVTGTRGSALRNLEEEWGTLMFFSSSSRPPGDEGMVGDEKTELLVIFGPRRGRLGAALKVMSAVEHKREGEGFYVKDSKFVGDIMKYLDGPEGLYVDQRVLQEPEFKYALGSNGSTRKKLAKASGCILEYVGTVAVMLGTKDERARAWDYLDWLLLQRQNGKCDIKVEGRDDVTVLDLESKYVGWVTGVRGRNLRKIEEETGVYLFANKEPKPNGEIAEHIMIFSNDEENRKRAYRSIMRSIDEKREADANGSRLVRGGTGGGGDNRAGGRKRSRSPRRRRGSDSRMHRSSPPRHKREPSPYSRGGRRSPGADRRRSRDDRDRGRDDRRGDDRGNRGDERRGDNRGGRGDDRGGRGDDRGGRGDDRGSRRRSRDRR